MPVYSIAHHPIYPDKVLAAAADAFYLIEDEVDEVMQLDADLRIEKQTEHLKNRCLEREYLPGAYLGGTTNFGPAGT